MSLELDRARIDEILDAIAQRLPGEWLLVGGALVAIWLEPRRVTEDIDIIGMSGSSSERLALMDLAVDLGLPVEVVNSAADFFVFRIPGWRTEIEVLRKGPHTTIYRPTPTLFLLLKIGRLSDRDLEDCRQLVRHARATAMPIDTARVDSTLAAISADDPRATHATELRKLLCEP